MSYEFEGVGIREEGLQELEGQGLELLIIREGIRGIRTINPGGVSQ
jgi:hypothetical protein